MYYETKTFGWVTYVSELLWPAEASTGTLERRSII